MQSLQKLNKPWVNAGKLFDNGNEALVYSCLTLKDLVSG